MNEFNNMTVGLSEEEDATFRLQISLVTARLFLRRYDQRKNP